MKTQQTFQYKIIQPNKDKELKLNTTIRQYRKCVNFYLHRIAKGKALKSIYKQAKENYDLPTALIQTARDIAKEQHKSYKNDKDNPHFPHYSGFTPMRTDKRTINFSKESNHFEYWANISTIKGKVRVPITGRNLEKLEGDFKSVQVIFKDDSFYLNVIFEEEHSIPKEKDFTHFVGVDLGINNIATIVVQNKSGEVLETKFFSGKQLMEKRRRISELKARLKSKGTMGGQTKKLRKKTRGQPSLNKYQQEFKRGQKVLIDLEPSEDGGRPHPRYQGTVGVVTGKQGECFKIELKSGKKPIVHPVHLRVIE